jgi:competence protein ComEA
MKSVLMGIAAAVSILSMDPVAAAPARAANEQAATQAATTPAINVNTASSADLQKLPGVGPAMAARTIEYREKNGGFKKLEDLMNVKGVGEKTFLKLKPLVTIAPPKLDAR